MEKCKVTELTEQNITDEEKSAAASRTHTQRSRQVVELERIINRYFMYICLQTGFCLLCVHRPFLDMVYSALDCTNDDYHALFVLCLLYAVSHSKGQYLMSPKPPRIHMYGSNGLLKVPDIMLWGQHLRKAIKEELSPMFLGCSPPKYPISSVPSYCLLWSPDILTLL